MGDVQAALSTMSRATLKLDGGRTRNSTSGEPQASPRARAAAPGASSGQQRGVELVDSREEFRDSRSQGPLLAHVSGHAPRGHGSMLGTAVRAATAHEDGAADRGAARSARRPPRVRRGFDPLWCWRGSALRDGHEEVRSGARTNMRPGRRRCRGSSERGRRRGFKRGFASRRVREHTALLRAQNRDRAGWC